MKITLPICDSIRLALPLFVRQVIGFPILVVLPACVAFLFGGTCSVWQWWLAIAVTLVIPFSNKDCKQACVSGALFLLFLAGLYVWLSFCSDDNLASDYTEYHLPAIRLLIEGWNPVRDPDMNFVLSSLKLEAWDMRYLHVQFCERAVWIFNAVAFKFFRQPYAVSIVLNPFLEVFLLFVCLKFARAIGWRRGYGLTLFVLTVFVKGIGWPVDDAVIFSSAILLLSMSMSVREGRLDLWGLLPSSFWLMNAKMSALLFCFAFWVVFVCVYCWRSHENRLKEFRKLVVCGLVLVAALVVTSWSPFVTSFSRYGHPFYPMMTADAEKYPVMDITGGFKQRNSDGEMLGYWGNFVNAYVSPRLVHAYYNRKLGRTDFAPRCWEWANDHGPDADAALTSSQRVMTQLALLILAILPGMRFFALQFLVAIFFVPPQYHGYLRYSAWVNFLSALAIVSLAQKLLHGHRGLEWSAAAFFSLYVIKNVSQVVLGSIAYFGEVEVDPKGNAEPVYAASYLDMGYSWLENRRNEIRLVTEKEKVKVSGKGQPGIRSRNNIKLLLKELGRENYGDVRSFSNEFSSSNLVEFHGGYFRRSDSPKANLTAMGLPERVRYTLSQKLIPFLKQGAALLWR